MCALRPDLATLPAGDATTVGEKGITLSGGQRARVALARALAPDPAILLLDEPFGALDHQTRELMQELLAEIWAGEGEQRKLVLFVTHDIDEAVYLGQRVLVLSNRPTVILEDVEVDLPDRRDQLETRATPRFAELRHHVYELIQQAKHGLRPDGEQVDA